jgi:hypothetical protein
VTILSEDDAVAGVRAAVGAPNGVAGRAWLVRRLDRPGETYYLVVLGDEGSSVAVGTVNPVTGDVAARELPGRTRRGRRRPGEDARRR